MSVGSLGLAPTPAAPNPTPLGLVRLFCSVVVLSRKQSTPVVREQPRRSAMACCVIPERRQRLARCWRDSLAQSRISSGRRSSASSSAGGSGERHGVGVPVYSLSVGQQSGRHWQILYTVATSTASGLAPTAGTLPRRVRWPRIVPAVRHCRRP
jgi:hypothetical protein